MGYTKAPVIKNSIYEMQITGVSSEGNGVGKIDNYAVFVPNAAIGDKLNVKIVKVLKNYGFGIIDSILEPSPARIDNDCESFYKCGGCCYRHIDYSNELIIKQQQVYDAFTRLGGFDIKPASIVGSSRFERYRNKAQYPLGIDENGNAVAGFYAKHSHRIIPCDDCALQPTEFSEILFEVVKFINDNKISIYDEKSHTGLLRHIYLRKAEISGEIMLCLVSTNKNIPEIDKLIKIINQKFKQVKSIVININKQHNNVIMGDKCFTVYGTPYITDTLCSVKVQISPLSFYQVNREQAEQLYQKAIDYADLDSNQCLLDLYCGIGTIGLAAASKAKSLIGVEIIPQAIENAKINAQLNGFNNTEFICADCGKATEQLVERGIKPDVIILDPPRKGCGVEVIDSVLKLSPKRVVMVSCNPATAARDCRILCDNGYDLVEYTPFDLFPRTGHVETVCLLSRNK